MRWVGSQMGPYPQQGVRTQGARDSETALNRALKAVEREANQRARRKTAKLEQRKGPLLPTYTSSNGLKTKPYGICVAVPLYLFLSVIFKAVVRPLISYIPGLQIYAKVLEDEVTKICSASLAFIWLYLRKLLPWLAQRKQYISF
jgi:hypothetical protein